MLATIEKYRSLQHLASSNQNLYLLFADALEQIEDQVNSTNPVDTESDFPFVLMGEAVGWPAVEVAHVAQRAQKLASLPPRELHFQPISEEDINLLNELVKPWENYPLNGLWALTIAKAVTGIASSVDKDVKPFTVLRQIYPSR